MIYIIYFYSVAERNYCTQQSLIYATCTECYVIELIMELTQKCRFDSEIGQSLNLREKEITFLSRNNCV